MRIIGNNNIDNGKSVLGHEEKPFTYIALGFFDGVHIGHQALLKSCIEKAREVQAVSTVLLLEPHPDKIVKELNHFYLLTPLPERIAMIKKLGIQQIIIIDFTPEFQSIRAEDFIVRMLFEQFKMRGVFFGYNYHFGYQKKGDFQLMEKLSRKYHFRYYLIEPVKTDENISISSTIIKEQLERGNILKANQWLGYPYKITGKVIHGDNRGAKILSVPTANIAIPEEKMLPKNGIYIALVEIGREIYQGLVNIGVKPTFKQKLKRAGVEVHIFEFHHNIYQQELSISLLKRIRDEKKFSRVEDLTMQINQDKLIAHTYFKENIIDYKTIHMNKKS